MMFDLDCKMRSLDSNRRLGWAFPYVNFAGKGFRYNLGARPRSPWDFNAKIHDMMFFVNNIKFDLRPPTDVNKRSKLAKADYIFRQLSRNAEPSFPEKLLNRLSKLVFLGADRSDFAEGDGFYNVINYEGLSLVNEHFMIPWSEIPGDEQDKIEQESKAQARKIFEQNTLKYIHETYGINVRLRVKVKAGKRIQEKPIKRKNRIIHDIYCELKYNQTASIDTQDWRTWAAGQFGELWLEALKI